ncbi:MAG: DUF2764 family protein [Candidatus Omnitrophica bacterium]|nr:DUF2764 family protein [Candidatus Omnitrophota bacterium]
MASMYPYLIPSLPLLLFGQRPPFDFEQFLARCRDLIPAEDFEMLAMCAQDNLLEQESARAALAHWIAFEKGLRNELTRIRASRKKIDPEKFLRSGASTEPSLYHIALNSHRIPSLVESEKSLDRERWQKLDELSLGHYFDLDALVVYALKLCILLRWEGVDKADKQRLLEAALV